MMTIRSLHRCCLPLVRLVLVCLCSSAGAGRAQAPEGALLELASAASVAGDAQAPAEPPPSSFEQMKAKAEAARDTDQIEEALRYYNQLLKMRPEWAEGWWHIGALNYDRDQYSPARDGFAKFVVLEPENGQGWGMLGLCEYQLGQHVNALQHLVKARTLGLGGNEELARVVRFHQALLLNLGEQFEAAMTILRGFALQNRESPAVLDAMGLSVLRIPGPVSSLTTEDQAMVRQFGKAAFLRVQDKQPDALRMFEELEAKYRGRPNVAYAYAVALVKETEGREKALEQFKKELERDPNHVPAMLQYGFESLAQDRPDQALPYAKKAAELMPKSFVPFYLQGQIYLKLNDLALAVRMLEEARLLAPASSKVLYSLALAYRRAGRSEDAAKTRAEFDKSRELEKRQGAVLPYSGEDEP